MDSLINQLTDNQIFLAATLIFIVVGGFTLVKRLWRPYNIYFNTANGLHSLSGDN